MFPNRRTFEDTLAAHRRLQRRVLARVTLAAVAFAAGFPLLLTRISPKREGAALWIITMAALFSIALTVGRSIERRLAAARVLCPRCQGELSGTWADTALAGDRCPHCDQPLYE